MQLKLQSSDITDSAILDLFYILLVSLASGGITILFFFPPLRCMCVIFTYRDALLTWLAVFRGVVGLSMALIVHFSARDGHLLERTGRRFRFHVGGVYFLTAVINVAVSTHREVPQAGREAPRADRRQAERV